MVGNGIALGFELCKIIHHFAAKEQAAIFQSWLIDDNLGSLGLDALHNALNSTLTEVVRVGLHCEAENANGRSGRSSIVSRVHIVLSVVVIACHLQHLVSYEVFTGAVALHNGAHHVLRHICIVGKELFGVLR